MKTFLEFSIAMLISAAIIAALFAIANHAIYKQDLRLCMAEGSKTDCENKLNGTQAK